MLPGEAYRRAGTVRWVGLAHRWIRLQALYANFGESQLVTQGVRALDFYGVYQAVIGAFKGAHAAQIIWENVCNQQADAGIPGDNCGGMKRRGLQAATAVAGGQVDADFRASPGAGGGIGIGEPVEAHHSGPLPGR